MKSSTFCTRQTWWAATCIVYNSKYWPTLSTKINESTDSLGKSRTFFYKCWPISNTILKKHRVRFRIKRSKRILRKLRGVWVSKKSGFKSLVKHRNIPSGKTNPSRISTSKIAKLEISSTLIFSRRKSKTERLSQNLSRGTFCHLLESNLRE